jgi:hypothetical protein
MPLANYRYRRGRRSALSPAELPLFKTNAATFSIRRALQTNQYNDKYLAGIEARIAPGTLDVRAPMRTVPDTVGIRGRNFD